MKKTTLNIVGKFGTILADPPWKFDNRTGKIAPENKKLKRYKTMDFDILGFFDLGNFTRFYLGIL